MCVGVLTRISPFTLSTRARHVTEGGDELTDGILVDRIENETLLKLDCEAIESTSAAAHGILNNNFRMIASNVVLHPLNGMSIIYAHYKIQNSEVEYSVTVC